MFGRKLAWALSLTAAASAMAGTPSSGLDYPSVWQCDSTKFNWYCQVEETKPTQRQPPKKAKTKEEIALEEIEKLRKELEAKRALAILQPTQENVKAYIAAQESLMQRASVFSDVWRRVIWQNPEMNYELKRPANNAAIATYTNLRKAEEKRTLDEINKEWGLFFFFRSDCPYCHRMAPTLKFLSEAYGITVLPVSLDGGGLSEYPNPLRDNGMAARLGIQQVPTLVLGNIRDKRLIPLGSGVISAQDVIERIYILTSTRPGELY
ncbi:conjugal transfer protein TraF [Tepidiphilus thermophilus]|uniref:F plasmid transfer operon protein n=1 Tax=Tepidiphilus thermophilus TaxID=876478 RepID=A0A0K6IYJ3_9PROT|nr:conjugal transfer protein TraF [Tepidiphilus thermophilus]CUB08109.1 F plasmid transfer operon protein [Tepidiphilus thermophilus]